MGEAKRKDAARKAGIHVPDRKFMSEFAVSLFTARWVMITPQQLMSGGSMEKTHADVVARSHIYLICKRPTQYLSNDYNYDGRFLTANLNYKLSGVEQRIPFKHRFELSDGAVKLDVPYPYREIRTLDAEDNVIRYLPVGTLSVVGPVRDKNLSTLEILYVGQAFGDGDRSAFERLKSHSTLQKILADTQYEYPDDEIQLFMFEYKPYRVISSFDGTAATAIRGSKDDSRFTSILDNPLSEKQQICLAEAGLIRYFQPHYNIKLKDSFPASDQKILDDCYRLDFSALIVELNTDDLGISLFSARVEPSEHHIARFNLFDSTIRRSFFTFVNKDGEAMEAQDAIEPSR